MCRKWGPGVPGHGWLRTRRVTVSIEVGDYPFSGRSNQMCRERTSHRHPCMHSTCWPWLPWWSGASRGGTACRTPECPPRLIASPLEARPHAPSLSLPLKPLPTWGRGFYLTDCIGGAGLLPRKDGWSLDEEVGVRSCKKEKEGSTSGKPPALQPCFSVDGAGF